ncbi:hypothetical protein HA402_002663 [Bradysia odoriphaga]|nr:hypothetical protein HA402_002663 [Bradysia odoriphaga]
MPGGSTGDSNSSGNSGSDSSNPPLPARFEANENWIVYFARLEQFFVAYSIEESNRKRAILLTSLSQDVYELLMDLCFPEPPEAKSYKEIHEILKEHFKPSVSVYSERRKFYEAQQKNSESVADYVARLKGLTRHCKFGSSFNDIVRDKFVCGLLKGPLFNKGMELEPTATLAACIEVVIKKEATLEQSGSTESMHYVKRSNPSCFVCGDANHKSKECRFKGYVCRSCNTKGHLAKMCKGKRKQAPGEAKQEQVGQHYVSLDDFNANDHLDEYDECDNERMGPGYGDD